MNLKISKKWVSVLVGFLPVFGTVLAIYLHFGASIFQYLPSESDEMNYWHQILDFSRYGFGGGYYNFEEHPSPLNFTHFGCHGPLFPMIFGSSGYLFGWHTYSGPIFNLVCICISLFIYLRFINPDLKQFILIGLLFLTFWPLYFFSATTYQESFHQSAAILMACVLIFLLSRPKPPSTWAKVFICFFIGFLALLRPTWGLLFIPILFLFYKPKSWIRSLFLLFMGGALIFVPFYLFFFLGPPYPFGFLTEWKHVLKESYHAGFLFLLKHFFDNVARLITFQNSHGLEIFQRYQYLFLFYALFFVYLYMDHLKSHLQIKESSSNSKAEFLFHFYNLLSILVLNILFYDFENWRDYRVFAPYLLMTLLILIARNRHLWIVGVIILSNFLAAPLFSKTYREWRVSNFIYDEEKNRSFQNSIAGHIEYRENQNAWCNTVLVYLSPWPFAQPLDLLPAGIGYSIVFDPLRLETPFKSKYALLDEKGHSELREKTQLQFLTQTPIGDLYLNLDSQCR